MICIIGYLQFVDVSIDVVSLGMENFSEIILRRKYFFSQPVQRLFEHLIYREVPELPAVSGDRINVIYGNYDTANNLNRSFEYHQQITLKVITLIKESAHRYQTERKWINFPRRRGLLRETIIWQYINRAVIVRLHDSFVVDDINFHFRYLCFNSIYEYLEFEKQRGTAIGENQFLIDLSDEYNFDLWFLNKLFNRGESQSV